MFPDCVLPGCRNPVAYDGDACNDCVQLFGAMLQPGPRLSAEEIAERDGYVRRQYALQREVV